ncbi:MAG: DUF434 domain-containing protein [Opitutus sp.]
MPNTRQHRGPHPDDAQLFAPEQVPSLRQAAAELCWLLDRGYALRSAVALTGNRHGLNQRQRLAVTRCVCSDKHRLRRAARQVASTAVAGEELWIDGFNLLILIESALAGGVILMGRDGCYRDLAGLHGTYRDVAETRTAAELIGAAAKNLHIRRCRWLLDRPVSNSGRLRDILQAIAEREGWDWQVELEFSPDRALSETSAIIVTSDSLVIDRCERWTNVGREIVGTALPHAHVIDLCALPAQ